MSGRKAVTHHNHQADTGAPAAGGVSPLVARKQQRPQFLTPREAAQVMRVSDDLVYDLIRAGEFPTPPGIFSFCAIRSIWSKIWPRLSSRAPVDLLHLRDHRVGDVHELGVGAVAAFPRRGDLGRDRMRA